MSQDAQVLECVECTRRYSAADVAGERFFPDTLVCRDCYVRMQQQPHNVSCFGKLTKRVGGRIYLGYSAKARECQELCPDRKICPRFIVFL